MNETQHILIVDDSLAMRGALVRTLRDGRFHFEQAENGIKGLEKVKSSHFDLIITDVDMPGMDGFTFCKTLREEALINATPVVILSSHDKESDIEHGFQVGASAYLSKTDAKEYLPGLVDRLLKKSSMIRQRLVLIVDDSPVIRDILSEGLIKEGFQVATAPNGKIALEALLDIKPDLIISDLNMPEMDGLSFCQTVHLRSDWSTIPFIAMSSESDRSKMRQFLQSGASTYIIKPFNLDQLIITIEKLLSDHFLLLLKERERFEGEQRLMIASIASLVEALEARDPYTRGHSEAVSDMVTSIGKKLNVPAKEIEAITIAARLHDLGKIGVRDEVLLKPGRLTDEEFDLIKQHPVIGAKILEPIPSLKKMIPIVLSHHERYDGKGYPDGLKKDQIPFWARMTAVADTYHALTSDRPYRKGMPQEKALQIIVEARETQLCPKCVDIFIEWLFEL
ncbi:MAG: response regulator [Desulfobacterales bacterium]|jgi:response regulator RpfG family c-di-GMP phosphodiesterase|nr:response regulator [Desulfobacterales bacterium]